MQRHATYPRIQIDHRPYYGDTYRHWSPESETYASADILLQYLRLGWVAEKLVAVETVMHAAHRHSNVFHFTLTHDGQTIKMPVLANPVVLDLMRRYKLTALRIDNVNHEETL